LDNSSILTYENQKSIAKLLTLPRLRLIASVDSIKIAVTWSLSNFFYIFSNYINFQVFIHKCIWNKNTLQDNVELSTNFQIEIIEKRNANKTNLEKFKHKPKKDCCDIS